ncbi:dephospho-CoA kinase [Roseiarcus fermentans]|uniref:Dephospho-CoA kinase n=1 Tax=Roseiarcus fermentans TaxID=1473586 RepID=A0A366FQF9_9HYPH|nr:dephospho-CoA kinase [Roseiarcus fermentans]RBP16376.1 dephospho-CoA kinase [Roseiarcus fermentans]
MIVAGLTGSIAMGKSTVAAMFAGFGAPVFDADAAVRAFYAGDGVETIGRAFPGVVVDGRVDRDRLSRVVLNEPAALARLEGLVHPAVAAMRKRFVSRAAGDGRRIAIVDVPLLFETGGDKEVDLVIVVSAPAPAQRARALARTGMTDEKLDAILARQMGDSEKRRRAHAVIDTGGSLEKTRAQVAQCLRAVAGLEGRRTDHA